ncbi:uncharacterized protein LOC141656949 [Silene latifolia]|uniref:uncharacterized protein LOC141656949 n=1 Tax=Silene latifolia TaxID=37657 RepID=UPI003D76B5A3
MAGNGSKKEKRRAKKAEKKASASATASTFTSAFASAFASASASGSGSASASTSEGSISITISEDASDFIRCRNEGKVKSLPADEFYSKMDDTLNEVPAVGNVMDGILRNMIHVGTIPAFTRRLSSLPCVLGKTLVLVQLLLVDEQKAAQVKLYALGSRVALANDDSDVVERSRKLFKDAAPTFMNDFGLWIFSRSLVRKAYNGSIDAAALEFSPYDPLESLDQLPVDPPSGIRCAEIFMFFAVDSDVPGDLSNREAMVEFLNCLNSKNGIRKIQAFSVTAGSVVATREKLHELRGNHQSA